MKNLALVVMLGLSVMPAFAASRSAVGAGRGGQGRSAATGNSMMSSSIRGIRGAHSNGAPAVPTKAPGDATVVDGNPSLAVPPEEMEPGDKDMREKEKLACLSNNLGVSNTFVWASRFSNVEDYSTMVEDMENPENNVCFVKVGVKSDDARVRVDDIPEKYFVWGDDIECGSWVDENMLSKRIADAKKSGRAWATVGGAVGGAGLGVGIMEAGGNRLIAKMGGEKVMGQKEMEGVELMRSQILALEKQDKSAYDSFMKDLAELRDECNKLGDDMNSNKGCQEWSVYFELVKTTTASN